MKKPDQTLGPIGWAKKKEPLFLLSLLAGIGGLCLFLLLAHGVQAGEKFVFDEWALRGFRHSSNLTQPIGPVWVERTMRDVTAFGSVVFLCVLCAAVGGFLMIKKQFSALVVLLAALGGGLLLNQGLKGLVGRPRPDLVPHLVEVDTASFPSGHALLSAAVYLTLGGLLARLNTEMRERIYIFCVAVFLSVLVGVSRVYFGVHYPSDVLGGWAVGLVWAICCHQGARYFQGRGKMQKKIL